MTGNTKGDGVNVPAHLQIDRVDRRGTTCELLATYPALKNGFSFLMLRQGTTLVLLWLVGTALRLTILVLAPLLPLIHRDLDLNETAIGTLGSLPSLLFACAAIPGALLIARVGARQTLVAGLFVIAAGCALRGAASDIGALYLATIVMAAGIAVIQPALPPLVRDWMPIGSASPPRFIRTAW